LFVVFVLVVVVEWGAWGFLPFDVGWWGFWMGLGAWDVGMFDFLFVQKLVGLRVTSPPDWVQIQLLALSARNNHATHF